MPGDQLAFDFSLSTTQRHRAATKKQDEEPEQLDLFSSWSWSPNIDIHLDGPDEAVATIAGKEPERAHDWLSGLTGGNLTIRKPRRVAFPAKYLDRFLALRPPAHVTLDAAATAVGRAIWAQKLDLKPLRVTKDQRRLVATSVRRWPAGFSIKDVPWSAIHACVYLGLPLEVDDKAQNLFAKKLKLAETKIATSGIAGSAVTIETSHPALVEKLDLPGLAYDGPARTGRYRLPILSAEPLLRQNVIEIPAQVRDAVTKATRPIKPLTDVPQPFPWTLFDFQAADAGRGLRILETTGGVLLAGDMGSGKSLTKSTALYTTKGPVRAGEVQVGDFLYGRDGRPTEVLGVYPQGERPMYRLTFTDGATAVVDDEHLWAVQSPVQKYRGNGFKVLSTRELREGGLQDKNGNNRWYIPMCEPVQFSESGPLPLDPYLLGVILGDGGVTQSSVSITTVDEFIAAEVVRLLPGETARLVSRPFNQATRERKATEQGIAPEAVRDSQYSVADGGDLKRRLVNLGLWGKSAWEKSVPEPYKFASVEDRIALIQGLLDTDGGLKNQKQLSSIEFTSTSEQLVDDIIWLTQSLGGTARKSAPVRKTYTYKGEKKIGRPAWRVFFAFPEGIKPFRLPRKADVYVDRVKYPPSRGIVSIEPAGTHDAVCFQVAAEDKLFLLDNFAPTHNTTVSLALAQHQDLFPLLVVSPLSAFSTWARQLGEMNRNYYMATGAPAKCWEEIENGNYEAVVMSFDRVMAFSELIERMHFKGVIADEIQRIRTPGSRRSRAMRGIAGAIPYRIGLSGTPLTNTVNDVLPLGAFLVPGEWKPSANDKDLEDLYPGDPTEALAEHLGSIMVRRRMDQVGRPLPKRNDHRIYIRLTPEQRRALEALEAEAEAAKEAGMFDDNSGRMHAFARLQKMRQIINSPSAAGVPGPNPKVGAAIDMAKEFLEKGRKGVIFCADRTTFKEIGKRLDEEQIGWVGIWGSTPPNDRIENERKFHNNDPAPNGHPTSVVVCTIQAGAESWSASPTGTWLISTAYVYAPSTLAQMEARVHRMNSDLNGPEIEIMYMHATGGGEKGSLDDRMVEILAIKQQLFAQVVDRRTHEDRTSVHYDMQDLVYLMTGKRDEKKSKANKDAAAAEAREQAKKEHARKTLYKNKGRNKELFRDDGSITHTLEEYRAQHPELAEMDDLDLMLDAADHLEDLDAE